MPKNLYLIFSKVKTWILMFGLAIILWQIIPEYSSPPPAELPEYLLREKVKSHLFPDSLKIAYDKEYAMFGKTLFMDPRLSSNGKVSCSSCHNPALSFTDGLVLSRGVGGTFRNAPTLVNVFSNTWFFHDGRADTLTGQALGPLLDPFEHGLSAVSLAHKVILLFGETYEALFGPVDRALLETSSNYSKFEFLGERELMPQAIRMYGIANIGTFSALDSILKSASKKSISPQEEFAWRSSGKVAGLPADSLPSDAASDTEPPENLKRLIEEIILNVGVSIESYERTIVANESSFDYFARRLSSAPKISDALSADFGASELSGLNIFLGKGKCTLCHQGPNFTDSHFHNIGLKWNPEVDDHKLPTGRAEAVLGLRKNPFGCKSEALFKARRKASLPVLRSCEEIDFLKMDSLEAVSAFKTPTLRNLKFTAPYMHDGRFLNLEDVIDHYNSPGDKSAIGHKEETIQPLSLTKREKSDLKAFLLSLESPVKSL
jgi:cytochrome c peroxidase